MVARGITRISLLVAGMGDFVDLERSYLEVELRLNNMSTNGLVAVADAASEANNTNFLYVTNNLGHTLFKQMNLSFNRILMSAKTNTYAWSAFPETIMTKGRRCWPGKLGELFERGGSSYQERAGRRSAQMSPCL